MAITFVAAGALAFNDTVTSQAIVAPTLQANDIMIACVQSSSGTSNVISAPDGTWAQVFQGWNSGGNWGMQYSVWWKEASAGDSGASFTFTKATDDNRTFGGMISAWRGCAASPLDATAAAATETSVAEDVTFPAFNPTATDVEVLFVAFYGQDLTTFAAAMSNDVNPDCTIRWDLEGNASIQDFSIACTSGNNDGSNIASRTWASNSTTNEANTGVVFALAPSSGLSISDTLALADALALKLGKVLTEAMTLSEALALKTGKVLDDTASLADAVSTVLLRTVSITDALSILDALSLKTGKAITETLTLADTISAMLLSLPTIQDYYMPRPLITLTVGVATKRYSTETLVA